MDETKKERRIKIVVPDIYRKVDEDVWFELETYIYQGFLTATSTILGKTFVFKSMNALEVRNVNFMRPTRGVSPDGANSFNAIFIAYSVFMVDGTNTLYERPRHINRLVKAIGKLPPNIQTKIIDNLAALNQRATRLFPLAEPYCHENRSRYRWLQISDIPVHSPMATGIPGTDELGMNQCQQMWTAVNRVLDRRDEMEREWQNAKFVGSCMAGKGIRSIDEKDRMRHEKERIEREDLKMKVLYAYLNRRVGAPEPKNRVQLPDGRWAEVVEGPQPDGKFRAETAEELAEQLEKALAGEKDYHDLVVEAKEKELRSRAREIQAAQKSFFYRPPALPNSGTQTAIGIGDQNGGTRVMGGKAEVDAYLERMKQLQNEQLKRAGRRMSQIDQKGEGFGEAPKKEPESGEE
jgi:hypothetical protein